MKKQVFVLCTGSTSHSLITVCDAAAENCPIQQDDCLHISFPDLAQIEGDGTAQKTIFHPLAGDIDHRILSALDG